MRSLSPEARRQLLYELQARLQPFIHAHIRPKMVEMLSEPIPEDEAADAARGLAALQRSFEAAEKAPEDEQYATLRKTLDDLEPQLNNRLPVDADLEKSIVGELMGPPSDELVNNATAHEAEGLAHTIAMRWLRAANEASKDGVLTLAMLDPEGLPAGMELERYLRSDCGWTISESDARGILLAFLGSLEPNERPFPQEAKLLLSGAMSVWYVPS